VSHRSFERLAVAGALSLFLCLSWRLGRSLGGAFDLLVVAAAVLASHAAADLVSGIVHWLADRVLAEDLPWLGRHFVQPFREHHADPAGLARHDLVETNGNTCIATLPLLAALALEPDPRPGDLGGLAAGAFGLGLAGWICLTNQVHQWAHLGEPPRLVALLQASGLILDPARHRRHHNAPFDSDFCITSGWFNPLLDRAGLFARLERWLGLAPEGGRRGGGARPTGTGAPGDPARG